MNGSNGAFRAPGPAPADRERIGRGASLASGTGFDRPGAARVSTTRGRPGAIPTRHLGAAALESLAGDAATLRRLTELLGTCQIELLIDQALVDRVSMLPRLDRRRRLLVRLKALGARTVRSPRPSSPPAAPGQVTP